MTRRGRIADQDVQGLLHLAKARALDRVAEEGLVAEVVAVGVELEQTRPLIQALIGGFQARRLGPDIDPHPGQDAGQLLHVGLAVTGTHPQGVQLHDLAGIVLVDLAGAVLVVVEVAQHGRVAQGRLQQIAELAQRPRPDRLVLVVADHGADIAFLGVDVEMVHPEPGHLLVELARGIEVAQQRPRRRLARQPGHGLLIILLRLGPLVRVGNSAGVADLGVHLHHQVGHGQAADRQVGDLLAHGGRQAIIGRRMQLLLQPAPRAFGRHVGGGGRALAPAQAVEQRQVVRLERGIGGRAAGQRQGADTAEDGQSQGSHKHAFLPTDC